jgi:hypothetical protein
LQEKTETGDGIVRVSNVTTPDAYRCTGRPSQRHGRDHLPGWRLRHPGH